MKSLTTSAVFICTAAFLLLTALEAPRVMAAGAVTDDTVAERISSAKTALDHDAIATYYHAQAAEKAKQVKNHEAMLKSYDNVAGVSKELMRNHCQTLISLYNQPQRAFEGLAAEHEKLAKAAGAGH